MKKLVLSAFLLTMSVQGIVESSTSMLDKVVQGCKNHWPVVIIPATVMAGYTYHKNTALHEYFKNLHAEKIQRAFSDLADLEQNCQKITLGIHTEKELMYNLEQMGLNKKNGLKPLYQFKNIQEIVNGYTSWVKPWCWTEEMKASSFQMQLFLQKYDIYKAYFEYHRPCLKAWAMGVYYKPLVLLGVTDLKQADKKAVALCKASGKYYLVDTVNHLSLEILFIKKFLQNAEYKALYSSVYEEMYELLSVLELTVEHIKSSLDYSKQNEKHAKDGSFPPSTQDFEYN